MLLMFSDRSFVLSFKAEVETLIPEVLLYLHLNSEIRRMTFLEPCSPLACLILIIFAASSSELVSSSKAEHHHGIEAAHGVLLYIHLCLTVDSILIVGILK